MSTTKKSTKVDRETPERPSAQGPGGPEKKAGEPHPVADGDHPPLTANPLGPTLLGKNEIQSIGESLDREEQEIKKNLG